MTPSLVPSQTPPRAARRRGEKTAERILDAAEDLFADRGFAGTTLRDVAARVGIRNPSLYNHFESKESLYEAVLTRGIGPVLEALSEFVEAEAYKDPAHVVEPVMEVLSRRPQIPRLILHETLSGGPHLTPMLRGWIEPTFARASQLVETSPGIRRWGTDQVPNLVLAMYHLVLGYFTIAPLYEALTGEDLLAPAALERQTRLIGQIAALLFQGPDDAIAPSPLRPGPVALE